MSDIGIEPWILLIPAILIGAVAILGFSRIRRSAKWQADRRTSERRRKDRRSEGDRRSDVRQKHDEAHNAERRGEDRRERERRGAEDWKSDYRKIRIQLEEKQQDNRNT